VNVRRLAAALCFAAGAVFLARCPDSNTISGPAPRATPALTPTPARSATPSLTAPARTATPASTPTPLGPGATLTGTGSVTWTSIVTTRTLCPELRDQVGSSYSLTVTLRTDGSSVVLTLDHHDDEPGTYVGTIAGGSITAVYQGPFGGLACPSDASVTPETRGDLTATLTSGGIAGQYDEVYGSGPDAVTFHFVIQARLDTP